MAAEILSPVLTDKDRSILVFEEEWIDQPRGRETAIRREFGWSAARYQQRLTQVIAPRRLRCTHSSCTGSRPDSGGGSSSVRGLCSTVSHDHRVQEKVQPLRSDAGRRGCGLVFAGAASGNRTRDLFITSEPQRSRLV